MIIVTGGAGFIGNNLVKAINKHFPEEEIIVVDNLENGHKYVNLLDCRLQDYVDKDDFLHELQQFSTTNTAIKAIFHQGACSVTTEWNGRYMISNNFEYSKQLLNFSLEHRIPFIYASSAAVYGMSRTFDETPEWERPLNVYGYSKLLFDQHVRRILPHAQSQIVGLRYFNVYGPGEQHKGSMASVAFHFNNQLKETGKLKLFMGCDGYSNGEQLRDFIYVDDAVDVNLWFLKNNACSGIFNVGTGRSQTFNDVANAVIEYHKKGEIEYIPFPKHLRGCYQSFTEANIEALRKVGCQHKFKSVKEGVTKYLATLENKENT